MASILLQQVNIILHVYVILLLSSVRWPTILIMIHNSLHIESLRLVVAYRKLWPILKHKQNKIQNIITLEQCTLYIYSRVYIGVLNYQVTNYIQH